MNFVKVVDLHCDVLMKMFQNHTISFIDSDLLAVNYKHLRKTNSKLQFFALYVPEQVHPMLRYEAVLQMIQLFYKKILTLPKMKHIQTKADYIALKADEIGAVLALEGCDAVQDDFTRLATLKELGVSSVGLTWNFSNIFADGAMEKRNAGLSLKGRQLVKWLKKHAITLDVSHLSEASFWDSISICGKVFASHSNCRAVCDHPRNLNDEQIIALINRRGLIGLTFVPHFVTTGHSATITHLLNHIEHICELGGSEYIGFGSDFDGTPQYVQGLDSYADYHTLQEELLKHYTYGQVEGFLQKNYEKFLFDD